MIRRRFKYFMPERNEFSTTGEETLLSVSEYYGVKPRSEAFDADAAEGRAASLEGYRTVKAGDFVMNYMLAWKGAYGVSDHDGIVSPAYAVYKIDPKYADQRFIHHRLRSEHMRSVFRAQSKGIIESRLRLYPDAFLSMELELPDLDTQKAIADFLDRETARIDQLIEKKNRMAALIDERSRNLIAQLVTGRVSEGRRTRDSGLNWCPIIPEDWQVRKGFHLGNIIGSIAGTESDSAENSVPYIKVNDLNLCDAGTLTSTSSHVVPASSFSGYGGDFLVFPKRGGAIYTNKVAIAPARSAIDPNIMGWRIYKDYETEFVMWLLKTRGLDDLADVSTVPQINNKHIYPEKFPIPNIDEQRKIVQQIKEVRHEADQIEGKVRSSVQLLVEFRSALITAAVTGQVDVATWGTQRQTDRRLVQIEEDMAAQETRA